MTKKESRLVLAGAMISAIFIAFVQDMFGLEGYIEHLRANWIPLYISLPINITVLIYAIYIIKQETKDEND